MFALVTESPIPIDPTRATRPLDRLKVLVVDDDADTRDLMCLMFDGTGASVLTAGTAAEALDIVVRGGLDVIVCDVGMPDEDGYSFLRTVRALPGNGVPETNDRRVPLRAIALTGYSRPEDRRAALEAGFDLHISKPFDAGQLIAAIASLSTSGHRR